MNISYLVWRLSFSALGLIGYLQGSLTLFWGVFGGPIAAEEARSVVTAFGFFSSFLTYILTTIVARKAYVRIQRLSAAVIAAQWSSLFLAILGLVTHLELFGWSDFLLKLALISWTGSLLVLFNVIWQIISVDRVKFRKP